MIAVPGKLRKSGMNENMFYRNKYNYEINKIKSKSKLRSYKDHIYL